MAAIELIAEEPVRIVHQRIVSCDGGMWTPNNNTQQQQKEKKGILTFSIVAIGDAALGHPKVYINLDKPGAHACGYCK